MILRLRRVSDNSASVRSVAQSLGVELTPLDVRDTGEIERGFAAFASAGDGGVIVTAGVQRLIASS